MEIRQIDFSHLNDELEVHYWDKESKSDKSAMCDTVTGESKGGGPTYWRLCRKNGDFVLVPEHAIHKPDRALLSYIYQRYYVRRLMALDTIRLRPWSETELEYFSGLPDDTIQDTIQVWAVNYDSDTWVIQTPNSVILHVAGGGEFVQAGDFKPAVKALFNGKTITVERIVVSTQEETI